MNQMSDSSNFSESGFFPLARKYSVIHIHAVYVKEGLRFAQDLSLENYVDSYS